MKLTRCYICDQWLPFKRMRIKSKYNAGYYCATKYDCSFWRWLR